MQLLFVCLPFCFHPLVFVSIFLLFPFWQTLVFIIPQMSYIWFQHFSLLTHLHIFIFHFFISASPSIPHAISNILLYVLQILLILFCSIKFASFLFLTMTHILFSSIHLTYIFISSTYFSNFPHKMPIYPFFLVFSPITNRENLVGQRKSITSTLLDSEVTI